MKEITLKLFKYDELATAAQDTAIKNALNNDLISYAWHDENTKSLEAFADMFNIKIKNWTQDSYNSSVKYDINNYSSILELSGLRLHKYLMNNYHTLLFKGKYYSKSKYINGKFINKTRYSKIILDNCCILTGFGIDDDILKPIYEFLENPFDKKFNKITYELLILRCIDHWIDAVENDIQACSTSEYIAEHLQVNEYYFDESGNITKY